MTQAEFIAYWSKARGAEYATPWGWKQDGFMELMAVPCPGDCGVAKCKGWVMTSADPWDAALYALQNPSLADWIPEHIRNSEEYKTALAEWGTSNDAR